MKRVVSVVVVDLDNTLFDWVDIWYRSFKAMLDVLVRESGVAEEILIRDFKGVHKKHGTSEYAFSIEELPALQEMYPGEDLRTRFAGAVEAYRKARESALRLYPTVLETLETLKDARCLLVGYTESMAFYSRYRMRSLGLDRILDYLYSPPDHEVPPRVQSAYPEERDRLRRTIHLELAAGTTKPNPGVLREIVRGVGATKEETIYVGDSLMKDVLMAQEAGVTGVWAKYGTAHNREEYELLRKVTHWKQSDVEREKRLRQNEIKPTFVLEKEFSEILSLFDFSPFIEKSRESLARVVDIWKKTVEVQQHFNDIELRIRNFAVTVLAAVLGVAAFAIKERLEVAFLGANRPAASLIFLLAIFPWLAFYFMDRFWYHRLLYGAVDHGRLIEKRWGRYLPEIVLTESIVRRSPFKLFCWFGPLVHSPRKIDLFYVWGVVSLALMSLISYFAQSVQTP